MYQIKKEVSENEIKSLLDISNFIIFKKVDNSDYLSNLLTDYNVREFQNLVINNEIDLFNDSNIESLIKIFQQAFFYKKEEYREDFLGIIITKLDNAIANAKNKEEKTKLYLIKDAISNLEFDFRSYSNELREQLTKENIKFKTKKGTFSFNLNEPKKRKKLIKLIEDSELDIESDETNKKNILTILKQMAFYPDSNDIEKFNFKLIYNAKIPRFLYTYYIENLTICDKKIRNGINKIIGIKTRKKIESLAKEEEKIIKFKTIDNTEFEFNLYNIRDRKNLISLINNNKIFFHNNPNNRDGIETIFQKIFFSKEKDKDTETFLDSIINNLIYNKENFVSKFDYVTKTDLRVLIDRCLNVEFYFQMDLNFLKEQVKKENIEFKTIEGEKFDFNLTDSRKREEFVDLIKNSKLDINYNKKSIQEICSQAAIYSDSGIGKNFIEEIKNFIAEDDYNLYLNYSLIYDKIRDVNNQQENNINNLDTSSKENTVDDSSEYSYDNSYESSEGSGENTGQNISLAEMRRKSEMLNTNFQRLDTNKNRTTSVEISSASSSLNNEQGIGEEFGLNV